MEMSQKERLCNLVECLILLSGMNEAHDYDGVESVDEALNYLESFLKRSLPSKSIYDKYIVEKPQKEEQFTTNDKVERLLTYFSSNITPLIKDSDTDGEMVILDSIHDYLTNMLEMIDQAMRSIESRVKTSKVKILSEILSNIKILTSINGDVSFTIIKTEDLMDKVFINKILNVFDKYPGNIDDVSIVVGEIKIVWKTL